MANREKVRARARAWYAVNREKVCAQVKAYREANQERVAAQQRASRGKANPEKTAARKRAWGAANRERINAQTKAYRQLHPGVAAMWHRRIRYGLTPEATAELLATQGGLCAICETPLDERMHVDHDHETNEVRGLLCGTCNSGLGFFKDNLALLRRAADYLTLPPIQARTLVTRSDHKEKTHAPSGSGSVEAL